MNHYTYNAWLVCNLPGVASIEMWRVRPDFDRPPTCLACIAKVRE